MFRNYIVLGCTQTLDISGMACLRDHDTMALEGFVKGPKSAVGKGVFESGRQATCTLESLLSFLHHRTCHSTASPTSLPRNTFLHQTNMI